MAQRLVTLRVRPARLVVLISAASPASDFVLVVRFLSQIWGGRFNPILAVAPEESDALTEFRLAEIRPEFVFALNLKDDIWQPAVDHACQPRRYINLDQEIAEDIRREPFLGLIHSDRAIASMFEARARPSAHVRSLTAVSVESSSELLPYYAAMFGMHPEKLNENYRDEHLSLEDPSAIDLISLHQDFVQEGKRSWLNAGSYGLDADRGVPPWFGPTIVLVRDVIRDLCLFWNVRLTSATTTPAWTIPIPETKAKDDDVQVALRDWLMSFARYGMEPNYCVVTSASVDKDAIQEMGNGLQASLAGSTIEYVDYQPPKYQIPQVVPFEYTTTWPVELNLHQLTIVPPEPRMFSTNGTSERWFVDIVKDNQTGRSIEDMRLPFSTVIPEILNAPCPPNWEQGIVARYGDGVDAINFQCTSDKELIHFQVPSAAEVLEEILREHHYELIPDEKRSSYLPTIKRFGNLSAAATAMSGQTGQVLEVLRSAPEALTLAQIMSKGKFGKGELSGDDYLQRIAGLLAQQSDRMKRVGVDRFRRYAEHELPEQMTVDAVLEHWADKSVLARQWQIGPCTTCHRNEIFVLRIDLSTPLRCPHCGDRLRLQPSTAMGYALRQSVRHSLDEGIVTVVLTGRLLRNMTSHGFFWLPGVKYQRNNCPGDIDVLACCDGHLVFGECKTLTSTPDDANTWNEIREKFLSLARVAIECDAALVVLAALVDSYPRHFEQQIEAELSGRIPYLLLTKADLEEGHRAKDGEGWPYIRLDDLISTKFPELPSERRAGGARQVKYGHGITCTE